MHSAKKGNQRHYGVKAHIGVGVDSGLMHTVRGTAAHVNDVTEGRSLLPGQETVVFAGAGYQGIDKRPDAKSGALWRIAMRPGKRKALDKSKVADAMIENAEQLKTSVLAKVEHPFCVIKRQFGYVKVHYRGLKKNTQQLVAVFALSNLWMMRSWLLAMGPQG